MSTYYFSTIVSGLFDEVIEKTTAALAAEGFGILTEIDVAATMKKKLDVDMPPYRILGACNPTFAHEALEAEGRIGTMLPCNVIVRSIKDGAVEVSAVDPIASMKAIENEQLGEIASEVRLRLQRVIAGLEQK
jgi:uncharacterized protein (DUF302 family)